MKGETARHRDGSVTFGGWDNAHLGCGLRITKDRLSECAGDTARNALGGDGFTLMD